MTIQLFDCCILKVIVGRRLIGKKKSKELNPVVQAVVATPTVN